jgi:putative ABC transport system permease protein
VGLPLTGGRTFGEADREDAPGVVIVSRGLAERYWPGRNPIGKRLKWGGPDSQALWLTVVGVAANARYRGMAATRLDVYVLFRQTQWRLNHLVLRTAGDPTAIVPELRRLLEQRDDRVEAVSVTTVEQLIHRSLRAPRSNTLLLGLFAALALAVGGVGIYGVLAGAVSQRRRELGVRMALGAPPGQVVRLIAMEALRLAGPGVLVGLPAALLLTWLLRDLLYGVSAVDPFTFLTIPLFVVAVALMASLVPAARGARVDPATVMRVE